MTGAEGHTVPTPTPDSFRSLGFGDVLERVFKICWQNAKSFSIVIALLVVPPNILFILAIAQLPTELFEPAQSGPFAQTPPGYSFDPGDLLVPGIVALVGFVLAVIGWACATAACYFIVESAYAGISTEWKRCLRAGAKRILSILWLAILTGLLLFLVFAVIFAPGLVAVIIARDFSSILLLILMFLLGLGALLALWVYWAPAPAVVITERIGGSKALRRSFQLVRGNFWWIAGVLFVMLVTGWVLGSLFSVPASLMSFAAGAVNPVLDLAVQLGAGTLSVFITLPLQVAVTALLYIDARVRKEAYTPVLLRSELQNSLR
jgi:hypothetical protein